MGIEEVNPIFNPMYLFLISLSPCDFCRTFLTLTIGSVPYSSENTSLGEKKSSKSVSVKQYSTTKTSGVCLTSVTVITPAECTIYANYSFN